MEPNDMTDAERQAAYLTDQFRKVFPQSQPDVQTADETIIVSLVADPYIPNDFWLMEIGSDEDVYVFELWLNGCESGIYLSFPLEEQD
jgi:hypothetical protein